MAALILALTLSVRSWPDSLVTINLSFDPGEWAYAMANPDLEIGVDAEIASGDWWSQCEIRVESQSGHYHPKASLRITFPPGETLHGFAELNLNAQYTDISRIRENLSLLFYRHMDPAAPFSAMTEVFFNGVSQGPYLFIEPLDEGFLQSPWLPDDGVLYRCGNRGASLHSPGYMHRYRKMTATHLPNYDLEWFIRWLSGVPDSAFVADITLRTHFDPILTGMAVNAWLGHRTVYSHNYHLILDEPGLFGRWRMIHGHMDRTWGNHGGTTLPYYHSADCPDPPNPLIWRIWTTPATMQAARARLFDLSGELPGWASGGVIDSLSDLVRPLVEVDPYRDFSMEDFDAEVLGLSLWPGERQAEMGEMLLHWPLPFRILGTVPGPGQAVTARWTSAERASIYRVLLSTDSTFADQGAVFWEEVTRDTSMVIHYSRFPEEAYIQVRALNGFREEAALNRSVPLAPPSGIPGTGTVVINEVFYRNGDYVKPGDWIELTNAGEEPVNLGGWAFRDTPDRNLHVIGDMILLPGEFLVLREEPGPFHSTYPDCHSVDPRPFQFGLSSGGEILRLYNYLGVQVDYVPYLPVPPWPTEPGDGGWSLALISPGRDGADPGSWFAVPDGGTPGLPNNAPPPWSQSFSLTVETLFPNPTSGFITAEVHISPGGPAVFRVFDLKGRLVSGPVEFEALRGVHSVAFNMTGFPPGIYFLTGAHAGMRVSGKFTLLR